jgi:hypothetical protein
MDNHELLMKYLKQSVSENLLEAAQAKQMFCKAAEVPIRKGIFDGPVLFDKVFNKISTPDDPAPRFPIHFLTPGTENEFAAYTVPQCGAIPYRTVSGEDIYIHTYRIANSIDACKHYIRRARWDVMQDMLEAYKAGFTYKLNKDAGHVLMKAGTDRGIVVADGQALQGQFTLRLMNLLITAMARNGGGNSTSMGGFRLTDLLISLEAMDDIRSWNTDQVDEYTRREIFTNNGMLRFHNVNLHVLYELGVGQELQDFAEDTLGIAMPVNGADNHTDVELCVGLDLSKRNTFVMPVSQEMNMSQDPYLDRMGRWGVYGDMEIGFGVLDARAVMLGSY